MTAVNLYHGEFVTVTSHRKVSKRFKYSIESGAVGSFTYRGKACFCYIRDYIYVSGFIVYQSGTSD
jgi:hypothetical protein